MEIRQKAARKIHLASQAFFGCRGKTNFFEKRVGEYQKAGVMNSLKGSSHALAFDADF